MVRPVHGPCRVVVIGPPFTAGDRTARTDRSLVHEASRHLGLSHRSAHGSSRKARSPVILSLLLTFALTTALPAQDVFEDPPVRGRPADFSWLVGTYRIQTSATPAEIAVEQPILLQVTVAGEGSAQYPPRQEKFQLFPADVGEQFFVEPVPELAQSWPDKKVWEFYYRLRPKSSDVSFIPSLKLWTYHPGRRKYQPAFADAIPITVRPHAAPEIVVPGSNVLAAPADCFVLRYQGPTAMPFWWWPSLGWVLAMGLPLGCWLVRRRALLDARRHRQSRAGRLAFAALAQVNGRAGEEVSRIVAGYLQQRLDYMVMEPTAAEAAAFLRRRGFSKPVQTDVAALLTSCAAQRFGPQVGQDGRPLVDQARSLLQTLEDQTC